MCTAHVFCIFIHITKFVIIELNECCSCAQHLFFWVFIHSTNYIITVCFTALPKKLLNHHHHGEHCKSKTDSQHWCQGEKTIHGKGKSHTNELPSSPRSRADRAAHRGALLNPTDVVELNPTNVELNPTNVELNSTDVKLNDVVDPALSAVNPSVSEINYGILSPARATCSQAKSAIGDNNICDNAVDEGIDLAYDSDSDDEDYRGDVYEDDYTVLVTSH